jgi:hypothetical protein
MNLGAVDAPRRRQVSGPGMRAFLNIAHQWQLSETERLRVLGLPGRSTYHGWAAKARAGEEFTLPFDTLLRISAVLGVYKALQIVFTREADGLEWLRSPNHGLVFGGQSPLELVTSGTQDGIMAVRRYLDAWRGGVFAAPVGRLDEEASPISDDEIVFL